MGEMKPHIVDFVLMHDKEHIVLGCKGNSYRVEYDRPSAIVSNKCRSLNRAKAGGGGDK
jgi:hypothetical protein